jgi:hypothetical protein
MKPLHPTDHLEDTTLLLFAEGELTLDAARHASEHLQQCAICRERQSALMDTEASIALPEPAPVIGSDAARTCLLASLTMQPASPRWTAWLSRPRLYVQLGAVAALLLVAVTWRQAYSPLQDRMAAYEDTGPEPNPSLTPGSTRPVGLSELCVQDDTDLDPPVSPEKQRAVFQAYGMDEHKAHAYQVDYLINPQLGGDDAPENLWPEPYHATVWNATAKDALETRLHGMVCSGQLNLSEAQHDLATDWIAAYKKYFHTSRPVKTVALLETSAVKQ